MKRKEREIRKDNKGKNLCNTSAALSTGLRNLWTNFLHNASLRSHNSQFLRLTLNLSSCSIHSL